MQRKRLYYRKRYFLLYQDAFWIEKFYQCLVNRAFIEQINRNLEAYIDDMVVKSVDLNSLMGDSEETFTKLRQINMTLNPKKCTFGVGFGKFLGIQVSKREIDVNKDRIEAILNMKEPEKPKDIQKLTGCLAALGRCLSRSAEKRLPFFQLLEKASKFEWNDSCREAFYELKEHLKLLSTLSKPMPEETLYLYLAASESAVSTVLVLERDQV